MCYDASVYNAFGSIIGLGSPRFCWHILGYFCHWGLGWKGMQRLERCGKRRLMVYSSLTLNSEDDKDNSGVKTSANNINNLPIQSRSEFHENANSVDKCIQTTSTKRRNNKEGSKPRRWFSVISFQVDVQFCEIKLLVVPFHATILQPCRFGG